MRWCWVIAAIALSAPFGCVRAWDAPGTDVPPPADQRALDGDGPRGEGAPDRGPLLLDGPAREVAPDLGNAGCPPPRLLCDGFEQPLPGPWTVVGGVTRVDATQGQVRSGGHAARLTVPAGGGDRSATLLFQTPAPLTTGQIVIRAHLYIASTISSSNLSLMEVSCGNPAQAKVSLDSQDGTLALVNLLDVRGYLSTNVPLPTGRWFCAELEVTIDDTSGTVVVRMDGKENANVSGVATTCGGINQAKVQIWTDTQPGVEMYVDDVVISTAPLGCQ